MRQAGLDTYGSMTPFAREVGIHISTLSYIINGKRCPSLKVLVKLVQALNRHLSKDKQIEPADLIRGKSNA